MKLNYGKLLITNFFFILVLELVFKLFVIKTIGGELLFIIAFAFLTANIITFLTCLSKNYRINRIINLVFLLVFSLIYSMITIYYSFYKTICGISSLAYGGQVMEFASAILTHVKANGFIIVILFTPLVIMFFLSFKDVYSYQKVRVKDSLALLFVSLVFCISFLELDINKNESMHNLVYKK